MAELEDQENVLLRVLKPYVEKLKKSGTLVTFHFFREPEIRFRVRLNSKKAKAREALREPREGREGIRRGGGQI